MSTDRRIAQSRPPRAGRSPGAVARSARMGTRALALGAALLGTLAGLASGIGVLAGAPAVDGSGSMARVRVDGPVAPARVEVPVSVSSVIAPAAPGRELEETRP